MRRINQDWNWILSTLVLISFSACSPLPYLEVNYRLPLRSESLKGQKVSLDLEDARPGKDMIGRGARDDFGNFSGNISLAVAHGAGTGVRMGVYETPSLFKEAFQKRLENAGAQVLSIKEKGVPDLTVVIQKFLLDLVDRQWTVQMAYEARLSKDGKVLARQIVSGEGERMKIMGRDQADVILGEVFTDLVNRVDLDRLFREAGL
jgi:hypothetical protein